MQAGHSPMQHTSVASGDTRARQPGKFLDTTFKQPQLSFQILCYSLLVFIFPTETKQSFQLKERR